MEDTVDTDMAAVSDTVAMEVNPAVFNALVFGCH